MTIPAIPDIDATNPQSVQSALDSMKEIIEILLGRRGTNADDQVVLQVDANTLDDYEEGTFTPTVANLTVVGTPSYSGYYIKIGDFVSGVIYCTATTSVASTANSTTFTTPFPVGHDSACAVTDTSVANLGNGLIYSDDNKIYTPTWSARTNVRIAFMYLI